MKSALQTRDSMSEMWSEQLYGDGTEPTVRNSTQNEGEESVVIDPFEIEYRKEQEKQSEVNEEIQEEKSQKR